METERNLIAHTRQSPGQDASRCCAHCDQNREFPYEHKLPLCGHCGRPVCEHCFVSTVPGTYEVDDSDYAPDCPYYPLD